MHLRWACEWRTGKSHEVHVSSLPFVLSGHFISWFWHASAIEGHLCWESVCYPFPVIFLEDLWWICPLMCECAFHLYDWDSHCLFVEREILVQFRLTAPWGTFWMIGRILILWSHEPMTKEGKWFFFLNTVWPQYSFDSRENRLGWNNLEIPKLVLFTYVIRKNWLDKICLQTSVLMGKSPSKRNLPFLPHALKIKVFWGSHRGAGHSCSLDSVPGPHPHPCKWKYSVWAPRNLS